MEGNSELYKIKKFKEYQGNKITYIGAKENYLELYIYKLARLDLLNSSAEIKKIIIKIKKLYTKYIKLQHEKKIMKFYNIKKGYNLKKHEKICQKLVRKYLNEYQFQKFLDKRGQTRAEYARELCDIAIKRVEIDGEI